jgi:hypothetical protein
MGERIDVDSTRLALLNAIVAHRRRGVQSLIDIAIL